MIPYFLIFKENPIFAINILEFLIIMYIKSKIFLKTTDQFFQLLLKEIKI